MKTKKFPGTPAAPLTEMQRQGIMVNGSVKNLKDQLTILLSGLESGFEMTRPELLDLRRAARQCSYLVFGLEKQANAMQKGCLPDLHALRQAGIKATKV